MGKESSFFHSGCVQDTGLSAELFEVGNATKYSKLFLNSLCLCECV